MNSFLATVPIYLLEQELWVQEDFQLYPNPEVGIKSNIPKLIQITTGIHLVTEPLEKSTIFNVWISTKTKKLFQAVGFKQSYSYKAQWKNEIYSMKFSWANFTENYGSMYK